MIMRQNKLSIKVALCNCYKKGVYNTYYLLGRVEHSQIVSVSAMVEFSTRPKQIKMGAIGHR